MFSFGTAHPLLPWSKLIVKKLWQCNLGLGCQCFQQPTVKKFSVFWKPTVLWFAPVSSKDQEGSSWNAWHYLLASCTICSIHSKGQVSFGWIKLSLRDLSYSLQELSTIVELFYFLLIREQSYYFDDCKFNTFFFKTFGIYKVIIYEIYFVC